MWQIDTQKDFGHLLEYYYRHITRQTAEIEFKICAQLFPLGSLNLSKLCQLLSSLHVAKISFADSALPDDIANELMSNIHPGVTTIDFSGNQLGAISAKNLPKILSIRPELRQLNISHNPFGDHLVGVLQFFSTQTMRLSLNIENTYVGVAHSDKVAQAIAEAVSYLHSIQIGDNNFLAAGKGVMGLYRTLRNSDGEFKLRGLELCEVPSAPVSSTSLSSSTVYQAPPTTTSQTYPSAAPSSSFYYAAPTDSPAFTPNIREIVISRVRQDVAETPTFYYALSDKKVYTKKDEVLTTTDALKLFKESTSFTLYQTLDSANKAKASQAETHSFFKGTTSPVIFKIALNESIFWSIGYSIKKKAKIATALLATDDEQSIMIIRSNVNADDLRSVVNEALGQYKEANSTVTSSGGLFGESGACSTFTTTSSSDTTGTRHDTSGIERAERFYDSLAGLEYPEIIEAIKDYANGYFNGNYDIGKSFKPILFERLVHRYGTPVEIGMLESKKIISQDDLLDALEKADSRIVANMDGVVNQRSSSFGHDPTW